MLPLLVRITNTSTGETEHQAFGSSPVRIGRNQLNEFCLNEPFVSQWHAVVRFDEHNVRYVDLGSTNGTMMDGRRLARHVQVAVDPQVELQIGPVKLAFARAQVTPDMYAAPKTTMFSLNALQGGGDGGMPVPSATMAFNPNDPSTLEQATMFFTGGAPGAGPAHAPTAPAMGMQQLLQIAEKTKPYYVQYRQAWASTLAQVKAELEKTPSHQREGLVFGLCQQFPQLAKEPEFRDVVSKLGINPAAVGEVDAAEWIKRLGGGGQLPAGAQVNTAVAMERVGALLESFSTSFVELRKGYEQFGEEMALQLVQERNPLHDAENSQDVLRYLLDWSTDGQGRVRELTRAFADLALHQVALLSGVMEGVRSMLQNVSPQQLSGQKTHALAKTGGGGLLEGLFNGKKAGLWKAYVDQHQKLIEEDRFSREVFGRNFARAYFMVTGGHMQGDDAPASSSPNVPQYGHPQTNPYQS